MAQITLIGRLGKDVEIKTVGQSTVAKLNVGETVGFSENKSTNWFSCVLWGKQAESKLVDFLTKGREVYISGEFKAREYNGKIYNEIRINEIRLTSGGQQGQQQAPQQQAPQQQGYAPQQQARQQQARQQPPADLDDDLPF